MPLRPHRALLTLPAIGCALVLASATSPANLPPAASLTDMSSRPDGRPPVAQERTLGIAEKAATLAVRMIGVPYRWGGESPESGFDCSGLVRWAYAQMGVGVPHESGALYSVGTEVSREALETGDVLFFTGFGHVGLYLGGGRMVHAPYSGKHVELVNLDASHYGGRLIGARRMVPS